MGLDSSEMCALAFAFSNQRILRCLIRQLFKRVDNTWSISIKEIELWINQKAIEIISLPDNDKDCDSLCLKHSLSSCRRTPVISCICRSVQADIDHTIKSEPPESGFGGWRSWGINSHFLYNSYLFKI